MSSSMDSNSGRAPGEPHAAGAIKVGSVLDRLSHGASWARAKGRPSLASLLEALREKLVLLDGYEYIEELRSDMGSLEDDVWRLQARVTDLELEVSSLRSELAQVVRESSATPTPAKRRKKRTA